jgi:hypothetical protein
MTKEELIEVVRVNQSELEILDEMCCDLINQVCKKKVAVKSVDDGSVWFSAAFAAGCATIVTCAVVKIFEMFGVL